MIKYRWIGRLLVGSPELLAKLLSPFSFGRDDFAVLFVCTLGFDTPLSAAQVSLFPYAEIYRMVLIFVNLFAYPL